MSSSCEGLLPGIPEDVTLAHIAAKLPWSAVQVLSSVSRTWQRAIQSREVYRERIRSYSTETLAVVSHVDTGFPTGPKNVISLYSTKENTFHRLPPIPRRPGRTCCSQFVSVDGKLYAICSGKKIRLSREESPECSGQHGIYLLDLAGKSMRWKKCSGIQERECQCALSLGCGRSNANGARFTHIRGGCAHYFNSSWRLSLSTDGVWKEGEREWVTTPVYTSIYYSYLSLVSLGLFDHFTVEGKAHSIRTRNSEHRHDIYVRDNCSESWRHQQSVSFHEIALELGAALGRSAPIRMVELQFILPINNELLVLSRWEVRDALSEDFPICVLLQSRGFGTESKEIAWQKVGPYTLRIHPDLSFFAMCPIQL